MDLKQPVFLLCLAVILTIIIVPSIQGKYYGNAIITTQSGQSISREKISPTWFYAGFSCEKGLRELMFTVGTTLCKYPETDLMKNKFSCKGNRLVCTGSRCPSRACSAGQRQSSVSEEYSVPQIKESKPTITNIGKPRS